jgi:hypothetical protein
LAQTFFKLVVCAGVGIVVVVVGIVIVVVVVVDGIFWYWCYACIL